MEELKTCSCCGQTKPRIEFWRSRAAPDGLCYYCIACSKIKWLEGSSRQHRMSAPKVDRRKKEHHRLAPSKDGGTEGERTPAQIYRGLVHQRRHEVDFNRGAFEYWHERQPDKCYYCEWSFGLERDARCTIDRKDNDLPYTLDNICLCCNRCNRVKSNVFTEEQMLQIAKDYLRPNRPWWA